MVLTISVITPSFNQGRFIERTIRSVLDQNVSELDYVVMDGGSTDETVAILMKFDRKLRWVSEKDGGQADAVNRGIQSTSGEIIGWLNSDDVYYSGAVCTVLDHFQRNPQCDVIYGKAHHIDSADQILEEYPTSPWSLERLHEVCFLCQPAVFFRRRVVEAHGLLDANLQYCMDYEYWLRLGQRGVRFDHISEVLAGSRLHEATKTLGSRVKVHREINDMFRRCTGRVPQRWLLNYAHAVLDNKGVSRARRRRFALGLMVQSCWASLRWNRRLSREVVGTTARWVWSSGKKAGE